MKKILASLIALFILVGVVGVAKANPIFFPPSVQTDNVATSTRAAATVTGPAVTLTFDAYGAGQPKAGEGAVLLLQQTASSSSAVLGITFQYSQDGIDWYGDAYKLSTTTSTISINQVKNYVWAPGTTAISLRAIDLYTPTRYVRASITTTVGTSSVWAQIISEKQQPE